uniref:Uncharacterized protein n=1 Tax=Magallana gigas TaxID=29159 RepID=K1RHQ9_MAGGI
MTDDSKLEENIGLCPKCGNPVEDDSFVRALEGDWHSDCFRYEKLIVIHLH